MATCEEILAQKTSWPELVGKDGKEAALVIEKENTNVVAEVILVGTPVPEIFKCNRVYVWVDDCGIVAQVPPIG